jgi:hypothetical protein
MVFVGAVLVQASVHAGLEIFCGLRLYEQRHNFRIILPDGFSRSMTASSICGASIAFENSRLSHSDDLIRSQLHCEETIGAWATRLSIRGRQIRVLN